MNYLDRFLSLYDLPSGKTWTTQLLVVVCLSIVAKMEETKVPLSVDLQVGEPKFVLGHLRSFSLPSFSCNGSGFCEVFQR
ncbi:hypothetical protein HRI_004575200 [Hibiscus trionum]|uniref:Cyclin N-terminal domain-containing protein n=1 Tax=Hibiscus trionum TaxID=183268 RepID=A0A9W7J834_HIBTR|nr:hypothetical protein HRI_004575200 [Hibiscus trionum]